MTTKRLCVALAALLVVIPASAQETKGQKKKMKADVAVTYGVDVDPVSGEYGVLYFAPQEAHGAAGKCSNCHKSQYSFGADPTVAWANVPLWDNRIRVGQYQHAGLLASSDAKAGVLFSTPDKATRAMLQLPGKGGIVVTGVCSQLGDRLAGLQPHDIVLKMNDAPATNLAAVDAMLASDEPVRLLVRRAGVDQTLVRKAKKNTGSSARFLIGVTMAEVEPVVRAQLKLDKSVKVYIQTVAKDGAAAEAGFKPHDIIVKLDEKPMATTEAVQAAIQKSKGQKLTFDVLRAGKARKLKVQARKVQEPTTAQWLVTGDQTWSTSTTGNGLVFMDLANPTIVSRRNFDVVTKDFAKRSSSVDARLSAIDKKLDELTRLIKSLK